MPKGGRVRVDSAAWSPIVARQTGELGEGLSEELNARDCRAISFAKTGTGASRKPPRRDTGHSIPWESHRALFAASLRHQDCRHPAGRCSSHVSRRSTCFRASKREGP